MTILVFETKAEVGAYVPGGTPPNVIGLAGNVVAGDMGSEVVLLKKVASEPSDHTGWVNMNGATGPWYELMRDNVNGWFFKDNALTADSGPAFQEAIECAAVLGGGVVRFPRLPVTMLIDSPIAPTDTVGGNPAPHTLRNKIIEIKLGGNKITLGPNLALQEGNPEVPPKVWLTLTGGPGSVLNSVTELYGNTMKLSSNASNYKKGMRGIFIDKSGSDPYFPGKLTSEFTINWADGSSGMVSFNPPISFPVPVLNDDTGLLDHTDVGLVVYFYNTQVTINGEGATITGPLLPIGDDPETLGQSAGGASVYGMELSLGVFEVKNLNMNYVAGGVELSEAIGFVSNCVIRGTYNFAGIKAIHGTQLYAHDLEISETRHAIDVGNSSPGHYQPSALVVNCRLAANRQAENEILYPGDGSGAVELHPNAKGAMLVNCEIRNGFRHNNGYLKFVGCSLYSETQYGLGLIAQNGTHGGSIEFDDCRWVVERFIEGFSVSGGQGAFESANYLFGSSVATQTFATGAVNHTNDVINFFSPITRAGRYRFKTTDTLPGNVLPLTDYYLFPRFMALNFDGQTANFTTVGQVVTGATSGAKGTIYLVHDAGSTGTLVLYDVEGTFVDNEIITATNGSATTNGVAVVVGRLDYDAQAANFVVGETVTQANSNATGMIVAQADAGATGYLMVTGGGRFVDNEMITSASGSATANIPNGIYIVQLATSYDDALDSVAVSISSSGNTGTHTLIASAPGGWAFRARNVELEVLGGDTWGDTPDLIFEAGNNLYDEFVIDGFSADLRDTGFNRIAIQPRGGGDGLMSIQNFNVRGCGLKINDSLVMNDWKTIRIGNGVIDNTGTDYSASALEIAGDTSKISVTQHVYVDDVDVETRGLGHAVQVGATASRGARARNVSVVYDGGTTLTAGAAGIFLSRNANIGPVSPETTLDFLFTVTGCSARRRNGTNTIAYGARLDNSGAVPSPQTTDPFKAHYLAAGNYFVAQNAPLYGGGLAVSW
jgi:hypothetical protein